MEYSQKWTNCEVQALLRIFSSEEIQRGFVLSKHNSEVYRNISAQLQELGIQHSVKQCREKLKKLKQDYKKIRDHNSLNSSDQRTGKWYASMDAVLGHKPANVESKDAEASDSSTSVKGKRKRRGTLVMLALKEMRELEEARRKEANAAVDHFLQKQSERESREAAVRARELSEERAEAAEARRQQAAFQKRFLDLFEKFVETKQASVPPTLD